MTEQSNAQASGNQALIVPDIHERVHVINKLEQKGYFDQASHIYLLGDYFDNFKADAGRATEIAKWLKKIAEDLKYTKLLGNHDIHYIAQTMAVRASGYNPSTQDIIWRELTQGDWNNFELFAIAGPYILSHAGFVKDTFHLAAPEMERIAMQMLFQHFTHEYFHAGFARGGRSSVGGPLWLDWREEFEVIEGSPQIVGHTVGKEIRSRTHATPKGQPERSFCIDTASKHIVWLDEDDGTIEFEELDIT